MNTNSSKPGRPQAGPAALRLLLETARRELAAERVSPPSPAICNCRWGSHDLGFINRHNGEVHERRVLLAEVRVALLERRIEAAA